MPPFPGRQTMQGVVFLIGCGGDDDDFGVNVTENGALYPRKPFGVDVFDGFQENCCVDGALSPIAVLERAEAHVQTFVADEEIEAKLLAGEGQCLGINVYTQQPDKLVVVAQPLQQLSATTAEIGHMTDSRSKQGFDGSIQAARLHKSLADGGIEVRLLDAGSAGFSTGVIVCTAHLAKGLEFDRVIVADVSAGNYRTEMDRNLLYVACTRAMHRLTLYSVGDPSPFLPASAQG